MNVPVLADAFCRQFSQHRQFCLKCLLVTFSNSQLKNNTNEHKKERIKGKFVSKNILNLSNLVSTENEIRVLDNGLNFVLTPETLDRYKIKKDLQRLGRDTKLRMHIKLNEHWTSPIRDAQRELHLNEIEDILLSIIESVKSYAMYDVRCLCTMIKL